MAILKKILDSIKGSFKGKSGDSVIGIDFGSSAIKVVQLKRKSGRAVLETYGAISLGPYADLKVGQTTNLSAEKLSEALTDLLRESKVTSKDSALSIPATASLVFMIEIPGAVKESEMSNVIPIEARKYIPIPISEVSLDWWIIPKDEYLQGGPNTIEERVDIKKGKVKTKVLVVAIRNDVISKYKKVIETNALESSTFEMEVFSSIRSSFSHELSSALLIDMGALKTKLSIVEYGIVRSFHTINRGSQDITNGLSKSLGISFDEAEEMKKEFGLFAEDRNTAQIMRLTVDYILTESNSVVLNYEKKYNKSISKVILIGGGVMLKGFLDVVAENFKSEVILGDPFSKIQAPAFLTDVLRGAGPEFAVALGLALRKLQ